MIPCCSKSPQRHAAMDCAIYLPHRCSVMVAKGPLIRWQGCSGEILPIRYENDFGIFGIPETDFEIFRSDSPVTDFFENGIGIRNFLSESIIGIGVVSEIIGFVSRNFPELCLGIFFGIFQHVIFSHRLYVDYSFLYFFGRFKIFWGIVGVGRQLRLTIWSLERIHYFLCTCYVLIIYNDREPTVCLFHTLEFRVFL
jgi:hypothetical protein